MLAIIMAIENDDDRDLAERIYLEYNQQMFRIANAVLKNETGAEDAVSDAFEKIILHIEKFRGISCNKTKGLIVIYIRRVCFDKLKRNKIIEFTDLNDDEPDTGLSTEDIVIEKTDYESLKNIISTLDYKYRDILRLKYFIGYTDFEIGEVMDISPENVRVRIHRAKTLLKKKLEEVREDGKQTIE